MPKTRFLVLCYAQLGEELKRIRKEKNLTIPEVAIHCNLSMENIEKLEQGQQLCFKKYNTLIHYYDKEIKIILE